jgi:hypothetical protein
MTTNETLDQHRPTDAFRDYLEGEVIHEFRRRRIFRRLRAAAVIVVSVGVGMTTTLASAQVRDNARRDSIVAAFVSEIQLAAMRYRLAKAQYDEEQKLVAAGAHASSSLLSAELQLQAAEHAVAVTMLNKREIDATGFPPRDDLNAPLVKETDFVKERLNAKAMLADRRLQNAERLRNEAKRREAVGAGTTAEVAERDLEVARARAELVGIAERMKARDEFLAKGTPVQELMHRMERVETQQALVIANKALELAQAALTLMEQKRAVGAVTEVDVLRARLAVAERQLELQRLSERMRSLK